MRAFVFPRLDVLCILGLCCALGCQSPGLFHREGNTLAVVTTKTPNDEIKPVGMDDGNSLSEKKSEQEILDQVASSALAYREQLLARDLSSKDALSAAKTASTPFEEARESFSNQATNTSPHTLATQVSYPNTGAAALSVVPAKLTSHSESTTKNLSQNSLRAVQSRTGRSEKSEQLTSFDTNSKMLPPPERKNATAATSLQEKVNPIVYSNSNLPTSSVPSSLSIWQDDLQQTITAWEQSTNHSPSSTQEVHQQMRLRMLYLLAGQKDNMLKPVPGATSAQQDYWSNQLFALSTFLDSEQQPRDKQRAAAALMHLDKAREKLAELGPLQIRNLMFVESVDGYGIYQPLSKQAFRPGQQVTLYAEVENFRSESTAEGQHSSLGTSYQVLDEQGHRVDAGQFPEVEDLCKAVRRDFHVQYGIALPTRIYPGKYELRLIVTDNLSNKLGQTSIGFEIVETAKP